MTPLLLVAGLFIYLSIVGQAVVSLFKPRIGVLWSWFVAPAIGLSVILIVITRLNVWGIPVRTAGPWATGILLALSAAILVWRRPILPLRKMAPFLWIALGALIYVGWPSLRFGFNWISYGNDDMANYCLAAERFLAHGYSRAATTPSTTGSCTRSSRSGRVPRSRWPGSARSRDGAPTRSSCRRS
jgi:hypothetical protein